MRRMLFGEGLRWFLGEVKAGRFRGADVFPFESFLANGVLEERYVGLKLLAVLHYLLRKCAANELYEQLDIVIYCHKRELPLRWQTTETLERLRRYCLTQPFSQHAIVRLQILSELNRRRESKVI